MKYVHVETGVLDGPKRRFNIYIIIPTHTSSIMGL